MSSFAENTLGQLWGLAITIVSLPFALSSKLLG